MAAATFVLSVTMTIFTEKVVCRMVGDGDGTLDESLIAKHRLTEDQEKGLRWAFMASFSSFSLWDFSRFQREHSCVMPRGISSKIPTL